jgi:hypothetical protein
LRFFGYLHKETTGVTEFVLVNGKATAVQFSPRSNRTALEALSALKGSVLCANADGRRMFVVGYLDPVVKRTPSGPNLAYPETYQEFTLQRWYITTPYLEYVWPAGREVDEEPDPVYRRHLSATSFNRPVPPGDLRRFERPRTSRLAPTAPPRTAHRS